MILYSVKHFRMKIIYKPDDGLYYKEITNILSYRIERNFLE